METSLNHRFWKHNQKIKKLVNLNNLRLKSYKAYKVLDIHRTPEKVFLIVNPQKYKSAPRTALFSSDSLNTFKACEVRDSPL